VVNPGCSLPSAPDPPFHPQPNLSQRLTITFRTILAPLRLALEARDSKFESDDGAQLCLDEWTRRIVDRPWDLPPGLVFQRETPNQGFGPGHVVVDDEFAVDVDRQVVPCRYDAPMLRLRGIQDGVMYDSGPWTIARASPRVSSRH